MGGTVNWDMNACHFALARKMYRSMREEQWRLIRDYLDENLLKDSGGLSGHGFYAVKKSQAGCGSSDYAPKNNEDANMRDIYNERFGEAGMPTYDLSAHRWIEIRHKSQPKKDDGLLISFQAPDFDKRSKNHHVLYDRIAIIDGGADGFEGSGNCDNTGLELPLSLEEVTTLTGYVEDRLCQWERKIEAAERSPEDGDTPGEEA